MEVTKWLSLRSSWSIRPNADIHLERLKVTNAKRPFSEAASHPSINASRCAAAERARASRS